MRCPRGKVEIYSRTEFRILRLGVRPQGRFQFGLRAGEREWMDGMGSHWMTIALDKTGGEGAHGLIDLVPQNVIFWRSPSRVVKLVVQAHRHCVMVESTVKRFARLSASPAVEMLVHPTQWYLDLSSDCLVSAYATIEWKVYSHDGLARRWMASSNTVCAYA